MHKYITINFFLLCRHWTALIRYIKRQRLKAIVSLYVEYAGKELCVNACYCVRNVKSLCGDGGNRQLRDGCVLKWLKFAFWFLHKVSSITLFFRSLKFKVDDWWLLFASFNFKVGSFCYINVSLMEICSKHWALDNGSLSAFWGLIGNRWEWNVY